MVFSILYPFSLPSSPPPPSIFPQLEEVVEEQRHAFKKQLSVLQEEIAAKETQIAQITEQYRARVRREA